MTYEDFLASKVLTAPPCGIEPQPVNSHCYAFQADIIRWGLRRGRAAFFWDCGLGKSLAQLEWARQISAATGGHVLILAPLAVAEQTVAEGQKFGITSVYVREHQPILDGGDTGSIFITNYEMLQHFEPSAFVGIVLDESSCLKHYDSKTRQQCIEAFRQTPYRLACTATPAPNDFAELGNHAEFLGVMTRAEMLSMFFTHDGGNTSQWRLKGHAERAFWEWVCSWAVMLRKPSDIGYPDGDFILPPITMEQVVTDSPPLDGFLFPVEARTLQERISARRLSVEDRVKECAERINATDEPWLIGCHLNKEADALEKAVDGAVQVSGSEDQEVKREKLLAFIRGDIKRLISKPSIVGLGLNLQHCPNVAMVGLSDSWEEWYQFVRRCWRFGQKKPVRLLVVSSEGEGQVLANIQRKEADAAKMIEQMISHMHTITEQNLKGAVETKDAYECDYAAGDAWEMHLGDCVAALRTIPDDSIGYSIFSPPFQSLYTYSATERDIGNCRTAEEFQAHMHFVAEELARVMQPGRCVSFHCMLLPTSKQNDGYIGLRDFRGDLIRVFQHQGFIFHSEVTIWKDPVTAMQRTKALGLLYKQLRKDSSMSRQGVPDYLVTMRKRGECAQPIHHTPDDYPVEEWQRVASPVWASFEGVDDQGFLRAVNPAKGNPDRCGILAGETLQRESAREDQDERHICPLQLEVIRRGVRLWSNKGDVVLSPFAGIASEGVVAVEQERRFLGIELKRSYWKQACENLRWWETRCQEKELL